METMLNLSSIVMIKRITHENKGIDVFHEYNPKL